MRKFIAVLLAAALLFAFSGCDKPTQEETTAATTHPSTQKDGVLNLAYSNSDTLNPYTCQTSRNHLLMPLIYDSLYKLDKNYTPVPVIAASSHVTADYISISLNVCNFSDGTQVTANDVVDSFNLAKESPAYAARLANFNSASPSGLTVGFELETPDPYALSCLTFPIIKSAGIEDVTSSEEENDGEKNPDNSAEDETIPVGCGRYIPQISGEDIYLVVNTQKADFNPSVKTIKLVSVRSEAELISSVEVGNTGFLYNDLSNGVYSRIGANTKEMGINNFVFLGFNPTNEQLANPEIRKAINLSLNREEIVSTAFQGHARIAYSPFNPDWYEVASKDLIVVRDTEKAAQALEASDGAGGELVLLVNSENQFKLEAAEFIKTQLEESGFKIRLKKQSAEEFANSIAAGGYDIYIGEIKLSANMNLNSLLTDPESGFGANPESESAKRYTQMLAGNCEIMDFINTFNSDMPLIPLCYRNAAVSYSNSMQGGFASCDGDVFYDIETWSFR